MSGNKIFIRKYDKKTEPGSYMIWVVDHKENVLHRYYSNGNVMDIPFINWENGQSFSDEPPIPDVMTISYEVAEQIAKAIHDWISEGQKYIFLPARVVCVVEAEYSKCFGETNVDEFIKEYSC